MAAVLGCAGWPDETRDDVTLAVDEAVQNAVEHGSTPAAPIEVELVLTHDVVDITVRDRGRLIIASLADEAVWGPGDGAEVRLRFERDAQR